MSEIWTEEILGSKKPIIAMCHLMALPGDPSFDKSGGMKKVVEWARKDLLALQNGGVDAVMFSNEFSMPYMTKVEAVTIAAMARIIGELKSEIRIPLGVNALWDPIASLDLAIAVDARFIREVFTGVYASDYGFWNPNGGAIIRHQFMVGAEKVKLLFNIVPESASYLASRDIGEIAKSTVFNMHPDALCVSGISAGAETNTETLKKVKNAVPESVVFANTGVKLENYIEKLRIADGAVVGTTFKYDGRFENHVDENRVKEFMDKVKVFRKS